MFIEGKRSENLTSQALYVGGRDKSNTHVAFKCRRLILGFRVLDLVLGDQCAD